MVILAEGEDVGGSFGAGDEDIYVVVLVRREDIWVVVLARCEDI